MERKFQPSKVLFLAANVLFMLNIVGILLTVILNSFSKSWTGFLPDKYTSEWYDYAFKHHEIPHLLWITILVVILVIGFSLLVAFPAAYVLAKREFRFKTVIMSLFLLPILIPPMTYGLPLAIMLYKINLAPNLAGVIIANMVPTVSFMILVLIPFIEQISNNIESAARMLGASRLKIFSRILIPLTLPGMLTAIVLSVTRVISMFELTFLVSGPKSQTLVVALFTDVNAPGFRPYQSVDALAVLFFLLTMVTFIISLKFVSPTQMVIKLDK